MGNYAGKVTCPENLDISTGAHNSSNTSLDDGFEDAINSTGSYTDLKAVDEVLLIGVIYGLVFLTGVIGNGLVVIVVFRFQYMRNVTNTYLASLSTTDMCLLIICIPLQYYKFISNVWMIGKFPCYFLHYVQGFTQICSVFTLTTISVERYLAIVHPMRALRVNSVNTARYAISLIWMTSLIAAIPHAVVVNYESVYHLGVPYYWCIRLGTNATQTGMPLEVFGVYQFTIVLLIPTIIIVFCYASVAHALGQPPSNASLPARSPSITSDTQLHVSSAKKFLRRSSAATDDKSKQQIVNMLALIVLLFLFCWTPFIVDDLLVGFNAFCSYSFSFWLRTQRMTFAIMAYANSCANPCVYAFMSRNFKSHFRLVFSQFWQSRRSFKRRQTLTLTQTSRSSGRHHVSGRGSMRQGRFSSLPFEPTIRRKSSVSFKVDNTTRLPVKLMPNDPDSINEALLMVNATDHHRGSTHSVGYIEEITRKEEQEP